MSKYKLYYYALRGRGELSRLLFTAANVEFENITFTEEEWPNYKTMMVNRQCPMLEVDGKKLSQSKAIERYLAKKFGLAGRDDWEQALVDQVHMTTDDIMPKYYDTDYEEDPQKKAGLIKDILEVHVPKIAEVFNRMYEENGGDNGFFVGNTFTMADLAVHECFTSFLMLDPNVLNKYPKILKHRKLVESQPRISEYLKKRPVYSM